VAIDNVLRDLFQLPLGSAGTILLDPDGAGVAAFLRTYAVAGGLTYGQYVPPLDASAAVASGLEGRIVGVSHDANRRTNLLLQNAHANAEGSEPRATTVTVALVDAAGSQVATLAVALAPGANVQINDLVPTLVGPGALLEDFVIVVTVAAQDFLSDSTGGVLAVASEVNGNVVPGTNDPRLVTARVLPATP
jgi:hypothetical protein